MKLTFTEYLMLSAIVLLILFTDYISQMVAFAILGG